MKIIVVGHTGFVGRAVYKLLKEKNYNVEGVNNSSLDRYTICDILINCAGNAKKYFAKENYYAACLIEDRILDRIKKIKAKKIIHISSINANDNSKYGLLKYRVERIIKGVYSDYCILRLGGLVGEGLSKNVVYDLLNDNPLWVTLDSVFNFIHTSAVAKLVEHLIRNWKASEIINVGANKSISVREIIGIIIKEPQVQKNAETEYNHINSGRLQTFFKTEDSEYYIRQYFHENLLYQM